MTAPRDPERWLSADDEVAKQLRPVLPLVRGEGPSASEHARMWSALVARLPVAAAGGGHATTAATVANVVDKPSWWWVAGSAVVATLFGFGLAVFVTRSTPALRSPQGPAAAAPAIPRADPAPEPPRIASSLDAVQSESPASAAGDHERAPVEPRPYAGMRPPKPTRPDSMRSLTIAKPTPSAAEARPTPSDVGNELDLLARARRVVASDPARALQLTAEHARRFSDGVLAQEREVLAIDALSRLGHRDLATARARRFIERYPDSAHRARLAAELEAP
jgi:hypothetical protein